MLMLSHIAESRPSIWLRRLIVQELAVWSPGVVSQTSSLGSRPSGYGTVFTGDNSKFLLESVGPRSALSQWKD
jgi:hypothetical protein